LIGFRQKLTNREEYTLESEHSTTLREMGFCREIRPLSDNGKGHSTFYASRLVPIIFLTDELKKYWSLVGKYDVSIPDKLIAIGFKDQSKEWAETIKRLGLPEYI